MKYSRLILIILLAIAAAAPSNAFAPNNLKWGAGIIFGEPLGVTAKYWLKSDVAIAASIGSSYYGAPRITGDYLLHFDAFKSKSVNLYFGPGAAIGFGGSGSLFYGEYKGESFTRNNDMRLAVRGIIGINILPKTIPMEYFIEVGTLISIIPRFMTAVDFAIGGRYYFK